MRCRICRKATLPGARLCGPCRAALGRARHADAATALGAEIALAGTKPAPGLPPKASTGTSTARAGPPPRHWPAAVMIASVVAAAATYAWLGGAVDAVRSNRDANATAPVHSRDAGPTSMASNQVAALVAQSGSRPAQASADPGTQDPTESPAHVRRIALRQLRATTPTRGDEVSALPGEAQPPSVPAQLSAAPPLSLAQAQPVERTSAPAPEGDRMQALDVAIAQCGGGLFEQLICGQRVRFKFCAGLWGRVPECPSGAAVDEPGR